MKLILLILALFLSLLARGNAFNSWFSKKKLFEACKVYNGTLDIEKGKVIQSLPTWGIPFQVSFDITVVSPPKKFGWYNVLQITTSASSSLYFPRINYYYYGYGYDVQFFEIRVPSGKAIRFYPIFNKTYHFQITQFFGQEGVQNHVQVDDYVLHAGDNKSNGRKLTNLKVFTSNHWSDPFTSDIGKVENLKIFAQSDCWGNKLPSSNVTHPDKCFVKKGVLAIEKSKNLLFYPNYNAFYLVSFDLTVTSWPTSNHVNILHATIGTNTFHNSYSGAHTPSVRLDGVSKTLHICFALSGTARYCALTLIALNQTVKFRIGQIPSNKAVHFMVEKDGVSIFHAENTWPQSFENVWFYTSNPWDDAFTSDFGKVENLMIFMKPDCKLESFNYEDLLLGRSTKGLDHILDKWRNNV